MIDEPLAQAAKRVRPGADRLGAVGGALFGSTIEPGACPSRNGRFGSGILYLDHDRVGIRRGDLRDALEQALVLVGAGGAALRSNENFTVAASTARRSGT